MTFQEEECIPRHAFFVYTMRISSHTNMSTSAHGKRPARKNARQTNEHAVIAVMAFVLAVSFFSVERSIGTGNEAHGQSTYGVMPMPWSYQSPVPYIKPITSRASSAAAKRAAQRNGRLGTSTSLRCADSACTNLLDSFEAGNPACLKVKACVKALNVAISSKFCWNDRTCTLLRSLKDFYVTSPDCISVSSPICEYDIRRIILLTK